ncbi:PREDICTED: uncharacterized protein LOC108760279 isoform X3 [Trachymyrmex cornetzi]|uniref:uncharacterized protein LOC108760279 isoform X3 n=1 Tax=Trachymyrmex cornetzi TaxID=471704 RepID=UPI00084F3900|nr:PREDICTED: uncharacterized protein LOC108760279 isoform X3 [Trachymyrmex cornetzi]
MIEEKSYITTWCPVCDNQVSVEEKDTYRLLTYIRKYHPEIAAKCLNNQNEDLRILLNRISSPVTPVDRNGKKKVYATRVDTWKLHGERKVCPQCQKEAVPTLHTRGNKLTTSHIGALCLFGCWPFCFIPLMMKRAKRVRMICPLCGHVYGNFEYKNAKLMPCKSTDVENSKAVGLASPISANFRMRATREESLEN